MNRLNFVMLLGTLTGCWHAEKAPTDAPTDPVTPTTTEVLPSPSPTSVPSAVAAQKPLDLRGQVLVLGLESVQRDPNLDRLLLAVAANAVANDSSRAKNRLVEIQAAWAEIFE